ncbi:hypothetical protein [Flavilitoribacter nigricans]|uniref:Uncharacterized protein n=1 Tax=Flavilitoribacter nigricans (strain ATCC 23147 / DSM 23189 / NBRC 102662 / NCIMB 1420 / SS-2) TaxID=1122177 RepID=A0A2D0MX89_FLAN2|nr:hypothetical protein [Flavilitoribacter nigricans]PHN00756.1 hypothetical protein CRP01_40565 [Flavilitoribacter nigricans DSM 23189 = NBRC 102662]
MAISLREKKLSGTGKRLDTGVKVTSFWGDPYEFQLRVLAYSPLKEEDLEELVERVVEQRKAWSSSKNNFVLRLPDYDATAFIPKTSITEPA